MAQLNIVMVEPEIPQNTGNVARTCAATGARLHLVGPMGFTIDDKKLKRAGLDYWHLLDITYYENLEEFFEKNKGGNFYYFSTKAPHRHTDLAYPDNCYLLFGKETAGLPEKLLFDNPDTTVRIPMIDEARSLNLSNSVAVGVYEVLRQWGYPDFSAADSSGPTAGPANNLFSFPPAVPLEAVLAAPVRRICAGQKPFRSWRAADFRIRPPAPKGPVLLFFSRGFKTGLQPLFCKYP